MLYQGSLILINISFQPIVNLNGQKVILQIIIIMYCTEVV